MSDVMLALNQIMRNKAMSDLAKNLKLRGITDLDAQYILELYEKLEEKQRRQAVKVRKTKRPLTN